MTCGMLFELLDRLPVACDTFVVRFTSKDRGISLEPADWYLDCDDKVVVLNHSLPEDYDKAFTVSKVKAILDGDECDEDECVAFSSVVYVGEEHKDGSLLFDILPDRFEINWKRKRVDVFVDFLNDFSLFES